jgi:hypothetical protein
MPVQAYVDDSGGKGHRRYFVLAGLVAHSDHWARFLDQWQACLEEKPKLKSFKMREAAGCTGQWRGFSETARDRRLLQFAKIINEWAKCVTVSVIDLDAHAETWALENEKPLDDPYFFPFHNTINAVCFELWDLSWQERFEIIFDENVIFGPRAKAWFPVVRDAMRRREPDAYQIMPIEPIFRSDDEFLPIQACDLMAWCNRQMATDIQDTTFHWVTGAIPNVYVMKYSQFYDRVRMQSVLDESDRMLRDGRITPEIVALWREYIKSLGA